MDLTMIDLDLLMDPARCAEVEPAALQGARFFSDLSQHLDHLLPAEQLFARREFVRLAAAHWPAGPKRPEEITALIERFGESDTVRT